MTKILKILFLTLVLHGLCESGDGQPNHPPLALTMHTPQTQELISQVHEGASNNIPMERRILAIVNGFFSGVALMALTNYYLENSEARKPIFFFAFYAPIPLIRTAFNLAHDLRDPFGTNIIRAIYTINVLDVIKKAPIQSLCYFGFMCMAGVGLLYLLPLIHLESAAYINAVCAAYLVLIGAEYLTAVVSNISFELVLDPAGERHLHS